MRADTDIIAVIAEDHSEDALAGATGLFYGLVITLAIYAVGFGIWWLF